MCGIPGSAGVVDFVACALFVLIPTSRLPLPELPSFFAGLPLFSWSASTPCSLLIPPVMCTFLPPFLILVVAMQLSILSTLNRKFENKAPRFLLSLTKAAMSTSHEGPTNAAGVVETVAREAGLSPSLRATVVEAAAAAAAAADKVSASATYLRNTAMVRVVVALFCLRHPGDLEACTALGIRFWRGVRRREGASSSSAFEFLLLLLCVFFLSLVNSFALSSGGC